MLSLECGVDTYTELGATALDACDGPAAVLIGGAVVNPSVAGIYVVTYDAADGGGNAAIQVIRTVNVLDNAAPVITLVGADPLTLECNGLIADPGATALDVCDGDLTGSIIATNDIVIGTPGAYEMRYNVTDGAGLSAVQVTRTVNVVDTQPPLLTLGVNWPFVTNVVSGFIEVPCGFALATNHPLDFLVVDACTGPILPPIRSDKLPGLPGVFGLPGQPGIYVYAWELGPGKIPLWTGIPGFSQPVVRRFDEIQLPPTGEYLLIYVVQDQTGNTYPPLDINGIPPIFDGAWNPIFQVADVLLPAIDFARLIRVNCGKSNPSAFNIATELDERFEVYDINDDGTLDESEIAAAYYVLQQIYPDLDQVTYNEIIDQLSSGTGMLNEVQVRAFVDAHDAPCDPDETPPSVLFKNITLELDEAGQASLFTSAALYGTAAITYLYDNCLGDGAENLSAFTITATQDAFTCDNVGDVEVTITVSDGIKTASGTVTVTVTEGAATCAGRCGCTGGCNKNLGVGDYRKMLADWLLIGVTLSCMFAYGAIRRH